jgi:hypothetical protein
MALVILILAPYLAGSVPDGVLCGELRFDRVSHYKQPIFARLVANYPLDLKYSVCRQIVKARARTVHQRQTNGNGHA